MFVVKCNLFICSIIASWDMFISFVTKDLMGRLNDKPLYHPVKYYSQYLLWNRGNLDIVQHDQHASRTKMVVKR